jgi:hydroxyacylglutathione hydrolase
MFFADLPDKAASLPKDKPIAAICSVGNRTSIAVSLLEKAGIKNVSNVLGGMTAWTNQNYPTKKEA